MSRRALLYPTDYCFARSLTTLLPDLVSYAYLSRLTIIGAIDKVGARVEYNAYAVL